MNREEIAVIAKYFVLTIFLFVACLGTAVAGFIYNDIPSPLPAHLPSQPFQAQQTAEFGDLIQFAGTNRALTNVTVVLDDGAKAADWLGSCPVSSSCTVSGWMHPITLNLYNVDNSGSNPAPGTLIAARTQTFAIPWNPGVNSGLSFTVSFDFTGVTVPNQIIYGVAYNTQTWGAPPIGVPGPFISLNVGVNNSGGPAPYGPPSVGSRPFPDTAYWNTSTGSLYADNGVGGVGIFRRDTGWTPYSAAASFETADVSALLATPVPTLSAWMLMFLVLVMLGFGVQRARKGR